MTTKRIWETSAFANNVARGHHIGLCPIHGRTTAQHIADTDDGEKVWYCHADSATGSTEAHDTESWIPAEASQ